MALKTMIKKINKAQAALDEELATARNTGKDAVAEFLGKSVPAGTAIEWTQGTPSFNDGDPCTFSVHDPYLIRFDVKQGAHEDAEGDEDGDEVSIALDTAIKKYGKPDKEKSYMQNDYGAPRTPEMIKSNTYVQVEKKYIDHGVPAIDGVTDDMLQKLRDAWDELPESLLEAAFGDGSRVRIDSDGEVTVEDYYCE